MHELALCAGYGGFPLALKRVFGDIHRTVGYVERESHAAAVLVARMADKTLDRAPIWDDLETFDGRPWRGRVDIITAGFPCQPFSSAGRRAGTDDDRWLWPDIERIIGDVRPGVVFVENVPDVVRHGLPEVLCTFATFGFDAEWGLFSAAAIGAPHKRERFYLVADSGRAGRREIVRGSPSDEGADGRRAKGGDVPDCSSEATVRDSAGVRLESDQRRRRRTKRPGTSDSGAHLADAASVDGGEQGTRSVPIARGDEGSEPGGFRGFPPTPDDVAGWERWVADGGPEPVVRRGVDGSTGKMVRPADFDDRLHLLGNGLIPQVAATAFRLLAERFER